MEGSSTATAVLRCQLVILRSDASLVRLVGRLATVPSGESESASERAKSSNCTAPRQVEASISADIEETWPAGVRWAPLGLPALAM